jgi:pimeloyl-ACP methyl ester carboxylesterase
MWPWEVLNFHVLPPPHWLLPIAESQPVLVLPGFTGGDPSTFLLRQLLRQHGHWVHGWRLGSNMGPTADAVSGMRARLEQLHERHGKPITIIGASLGGVFARALAREVPSHVAQVITLGSPFRVMEGDRTVGQALWDAVKHLHIDELVSLEVAEEDRPPLTVPATAIYTRTDGVVRWELCVEHTGDHARSRRAENIEVYGTHTALSANSTAAFAILDRLARDTATWQPFRPPALLQAFYPRGVEAEHNLTQVVGL